MWDRVSGKEIARLEGHQGPVIMGRFSPDGTRIVTTSADGTARLWHSDDGSLITTFRVPDQTVAHAVFSRTGDRVITTCSDGVVRFWILDPDELLRFAEAEAFRDFTDAERQRYRTLLED